MRSRVVGLMLLSVLSAGCADVGAGGPQDAAVRFARSSPTDACGLLAPETVESVESHGGTDCPQGLAQLHLPTGTQVRGVEVAGEGAQVMMADQVIFLARFPEGWRVTAAGCIRNDVDPAVPYDCEVEP